MLDEVEKSIVDALKDLCNNPDSKKWENPRWTTEVKNTLGRIGKGKKYLVYASGCDFRSGGEWLYDLTWLVYEGDYLVDVPLILELEWGEDPETINDDFQKLLLGRAEHRIMIFSARNSIRFNNTVNDLITQIKECKRSMPGDRYLFVCWVNDSQIFDFRSFVFDS